MTLARHGAVVNGPISCFSSFVVLPFKATVQLSFWFQIVFNIERVEFLRVTRLEKTNTVGLKY
ncbi:hypothetical protein L207DRAFT_513022 [Hyaloscypha variabilis F]|jgi:hypothetical protein|uniref:Uncharacterized protein n=1 Tax=Hyaloscypha variabilis (strain UAMH 11265 / GT02V1 / F) TaxID=1149755 RepID=A0A2J6RNH4_HYAVF|nr:hypothetical protein L207DRAFT_513022 [Hyaloscypha variabilis F]